MYLGITFPFALSPSLARRFFSDIKRKERNRPRSGLAAETTFLSSKREEKSVSNSAPRPKQESDDEHKNKVGTKTLRTIPRALAESLVTICGPLPTQRVNLIHTVAKSDFGARSNRYSLNSFGYWVIATAASCAICFLLSVASPASNWADLSTAHFPRFRVSFRGSVQEATEPAERER